MNKIYQEYLEQLDFMLDWIENLKIEIVKLPYNENDYRKEYFQTSLRNTSQYYIGYMTFVKAQLLFNNKITLTDEFKGYQRHKEKITELAYQYDKQDAYYHSLNHRMFIMAWSLFEFYISKVYSNVTTKKESTSFIPIYKKIKYLFANIKGYSRNIKEDKAFLHFFGSLRNTMHSNFIFYGKNYEFRFGDAHFVFNNGKRVEWSDPFDNIHVPSPMLYFHLVGNLIQITKEIFKCYPHEEVIYSNVNAFYSQPE